MSLNLFRSVVVDNIVLNEKFNSLVLKQQDSFNFELGQFVTLKVGDRLFRSYSISSHSKRIPYWEMFVDITPGGPGTTYIKNLKKGDVIETTKALGSFTLEKKISDKYCMVATGCGLAPLKPMMEELLVSGKKVNFLWGLRKESEVAFKDIFDSWSKEYNFRYQIVLSQSSGRQGLKGYVTDHCHPSKEMELYMAGSGQFVKDFLKKLSENKFPEDKIHFEQCYFEV